MANVLLSYTRSDRSWAFWVAAQLEAFGHTPHVAEWELRPGENVMSWMEERHAESDQIACVISNDFLNQPYSAWERRAVQWAAVSKRANFLVPLVVEPCEMPTLLASLARCDLFGLDENEANSRLLDTFGMVQPQANAKHTGIKTPHNVPFPGARPVVANTTVSVPREFLGRDDVLAAIKQSLDSGRLTVTILSGTRGVGKTTVAAAFAANQRNNYRLTWWVRAQTDTTIRADLIALAMRLGWGAMDGREDATMAVVGERLRLEGDSILLIFDGAVDPDSVRPYIPRGGSHVLITSTFTEWRGIGAQLQIEPWPKETGADYLIARTGQVRERLTAETLSEELGGLPLAHEQAATYCDRLGISLRDYLNRFSEVPLRKLDSVFTDATAVIRTFDLAIEEASKLQPAAETLLVYCSFLAPEPIALFLFAEAGAVLGEPFTSQIANDGLDEAVAALRAFGLIDREAVIDEKEPNLVVDSVRIHRLVAQVARSRWPKNKKENILKRLVEALATAYPQETDVHPTAWVKARRLDVHALALLGDQTELPRGAEEAAISLLNGMVLYRLYAFGPTSEARSLAARAVALSESSFGPQHPSTLVSLRLLAVVLQQQGDLTSAQALLENILAIDERQLGAQHPRIARDLNGLAEILRQKGDLASARLLLDRALSIHEKALGPDHRDIAQILATLGALCRNMNENGAAIAYLERALSINERAFGPDHPTTVASLGSLGIAYSMRGDRVRPIFERALAINEKTFGPDHPETATSLYNLALSLRTEGEFGAAQTILARALLIRERSLGNDHPATASAVRALARVLEDQGSFSEARPFYERALDIYRNKMPGSQVVQMIQDDLARLDAKGADTATAQERRISIERLIKSARDDATRDTLSNLLARDNDPDNRCFIISNIVEIWPDDRSRDLTIRLARDDESPDVRALACEYLAQVWWRHRAARDTLRSQVQLPSNEPVKKRLSDAVGGASVQVTQFWEKTLTGGRASGEEVEMVPGYPAFGVRRFRVRDIGPIRDSGIVELDERTNVFLGDNAAGKTTILRAIGLAAIGLPAANEVEDNALSYLRKGAVLGTIEVLFSLLPDPDSDPATAGHFSVGLQISEGSSRFAAIPDVEMSLPNPSSKSGYLVNSAESLGEIRSVWPSQFGFVSGYGSVRTFSDNRFSIQSEAQKRENEWVQSLFRADAQLVNPEVFAKLIRGDTSNIEGAPVSSISPNLIDALRNATTRLFPDVNKFYSKGDTDLQINNTDLRFGELSEGYRSLLALLGHMLRCALRVCAWVEDPTKLAGIVLIDELDLHLHPLWQARIVQDLRHAFPNLQLVASTHSPLLVGALERDQVLTMSRHEDGGTVVGRPEINPQGLGVSGVLTSIFDLNSTIDQPTLDKINRRLLLHGRRDEWSDNEREEYRYLSDDLARLGFNREHSDPYFARFAVAMAKRHRETIGKLSPDEREELDRYASRLLDEIVGEEAP